MSDFFKVTFEEDGVFLEFEAAALDDTLLRSSISKYILKKAIADINLMEVAEALKHPGKKCLIAPAQQELAIDETAEVSVSGDNMAAFLTFSPADGGKLLTYDQIADTLIAFNVVHGYDENQLQALAESEYKPYGYPIPVANGDAPVPGEDAYVEYHFRVSHDKMPRILEDGSVDHKSLDLFESVRKDTLLATLHPETQGIPGIDVFGAQLRPQPGRPMKIPKGSNTLVSPNGLALHAEIDGNVELLGGKVSVLPVFTVNGDVSPATGNIDFFGDVIIRGSVLSRYKVVATGTVDISGVVEAAVVKAEGNVIIRQGVKGKSECTIIAGGDVTAKFIENANVEAMGTIRADVIMNSSISAFDSVQVSGKHGIIVGGVTRATKFVVADDIGNQHMTPTLVEVGITPHSRKRYNALCKELIATRANLNQLAGLTSRLETLEKRGVKLTMEQREKLIGYRESVEKYAMRLTKQTQEIENIKLLLELTAMGAVHVRDVIYSGVTVAAGNISERLSSSFKFCTLTRGDGKLDLSSFAFR